MEATDRSADGPEGFSRAPRGDWRSMTLMSDAQVRAIGRMADVRDFDRPGGGSIVSKVQRRLRFVFFKYLTAPFFRSTWQRQVDFNRRTAGVAQALSAMEARIRELEAQLATLQQFSK